MVVQPGLFRQVHGTAATATSLIADSQQVNSVHWAVQPRRHPRAVNGAGVLRVRHSSSSSACVSGPSSAFIGTVCSTR